MEEPADDRIGQHFGDFEIESFLANGAMGFVYVACQLSLDNRRVALKLLPEDGQTDATIKRFHREARVLADLHHKGLAEVYGSGEAHGCLFFAMRLVHGPTLHEVIMERRQMPSLPLDRPVQRYFVQLIVDVAEALIAMGKADLVHRDIKPANIILDLENDDRAVLVDFGLARHVGPVSAAPTRGFSGTMEFAPPEQLQGGLPTASGDVFSLGVTLHDLLASRTPADRDQASRGLDALQSLVPDIDSDLSAVVARAIDPVAKWRYPDAAALHGDLRAWLDGRPVSARRLPALEFCERWLRLHSSQVLKVAAGALVVLLVGIGLVTCSGWARSAVLANRAARSMDLAQVDGHMRSVPRILWPAFAWFSSPNLGGFLQGLGPNPADEDLARVAQCLREGQSDAALREAATALRVHGLEHHPLLVGLLEHALLEECAKSPAEPTQRLSPVFRHVARLFYERPLTTPSASLASAPLRAALVHSLDHLPRGRLRDRSYALTALSGCAGAGELDAMIRIVLDPLSGKETRRLAVSATERSLRRLHRTGGLGSERLESWIERLGPAQIRAYAEDPNIGSKELASLTLTSLAHAAVAVDRRDLIAQLTPESAELPALGSLEVTLGALAHDPATLRRVQGSGVHELPTATAAILIAALDGSPPAARIRAQARAHYSADPVSLHAFEHELLLAAQHAQGIRTKLLLDADSQLGYVDERATGPRPLQMKRSPEPHAGALWVLNSEPPFVAGMATGTSYDFGTFHRDYPESGRPQFLRLWSFGQSWVRFGFEVDETREARPATLLLWHVAASRGYYPNRGEAYLEIYLDDQLIGEHLLPNLAVPYWTKNPSTQIPVPMDRLEPGAHALELRLSDRTTSTYRVVRAELQPKDF